MSLFICRIQRFISLVASAGASVAKAGRADGKFEGVNSGSMAYAASAGKEA